MTKGARIAIGIGVLALVATFVGASLRKGHQRAGKDVQWETVSLRTIESWVRAPGEVQPARLVQLSSNVMGRVAAVHVREGDHVHQGQRLLELDAERFESAVAQTRARFEAAQANLRVARLNAERSEQALDRKEKLFAQKLVSPEEVEQARSQTAVDQARWTAAQEEIREVKAALAEAEKNTRETVFEAPIDGVITALNVEPGENVVTGTMNNAGTVILTLSDLDTIDVEAEVDETDVIRLAVGQSAKVLVDALPDTTLGGALRVIGQSGRRGSGGNQTQTIHFLVRVQVESPPLSLRPGMSADVEILAGRADSTLAIPIQALVASPKSVVERWKTERAREGVKGRRKLRSGGAASAAFGDTTGKSREELIEGLFVEREGTARFVAVELGIRGDTHIQIRGEVSVGDRIITGPYRILRNLADGDLVRQEKQKAKKRGGSETK